MGRDSPPMYPMSDVARASSRQDLLYTNPGVFLPPPTTASSLANDVHVWSPLSLHHPSFQSSRSPHAPATHHSGPWSSALLSAYMMHLLPQHHLTPESGRHSPPRKPLPFIHEPQAYGRSAMDTSSHRQTPSPPGRQVDVREGGRRGETARKVDVDSD